MKNGVYALLAIVVGVTLVGLLPGQLSNLAASNVVMTSLEGSKQAAGNATLSGSTPLRPSGSANVTLGGTITSTGQAADTDDDIEFAVTAAPNDRYADIMYYGMWGVGFIAAFGIYLVAKRMLG